jgi:DNA-binding XRE family transcriptional regulator
MVFVRRKKMHGKHYYQLVRNSREGGKHRQKVLCHLGVHDSIEAAIADTQRQVVHYEKEAASREEEAYRIEAHLKDRYGDEYEIIDEDQAHYWLAWLRWNDPRYMIPYYVPSYYEEPERDQMRENWEIDKLAADLSIAYHDAMRGAEGYRVRTARTRTRLNKLLECQRRYFHQQGQAAERKRDDVRELLTRSAYQATLPSSHTPVAVTRAQEPDRTESHEVDKKRGNDRTESPKVNRKRSRHKIDGRKVQLLREVRVVDQGELAERAGVSQVTISDIERGRRPFPQPDTIRALAKALGVAPEVLAIRD